MGDIILGLGPLLLGGGVLGIAGPVDGGGEGAAGAEAGGDGVVGLGGEEGRDISEHEVESEGWARPGLTRLGLGEAEGDI